MNAIMAAKMRRNLEFDTPYTVTNALSKGGAETKLSALVMGLGNMAHKQVLKGLLFLAAEVAYIAFMVTNGVHNLQMIITLGSVERQEVWNEELLYGLATIILTGVMFWVWRGTLKSAYKAECFDKAGKHVNTFQEDLKSLLDENIYRLLMTPPMLFITALTILPLVFMICMAFTNYSKIDNHLVLFDWVGLENFAALFDSNSILGSTFWSHQPQRYQSQGLLAVLFRSALRGADVRLAADHAHHAAARRRSQRAFAPAGFDCRRREPAVFHRPHLGAHHGHRHQHLGRRSVYAAAADRRAAEHPDRTV